MIWCRSAKEKNGYVSNIGHQHFWKVYWIFLIKAKLSNYLSSFFRLFLCYLMNHSEIRKFFIISLFFHQFRFGVWEKKSFFLQFLKFCPLDSDPWIRIFLRIRKAKILRIQISRSASSALSNSMIKDSNLFTCRADIPELLGVKHDFERR